MFVVFCTVPKGKGKEIAEKLLDEGLCACINISQVISIFRWKGKIEEENEELLIIKTAEKNYKKLEKRIKTIHPYELPEIIAFKIEKGFKKYIDWVEK